MASYMDAVEGKHTDGREQGIGMNDEQLIDALIEQIKQDVKNQDFTAIEELLWEVPRSKLIAYLPEEKQNA